MASAQPIQRPGLYLIPNATTLGAEGLEEGFLFRGHVFEPMPHGIAMLLHCLMPGAHRFTTRLRIGLLALLGLGGACRKQEAKSEERQSRLHSSLL